MDWRKHSQKNLLSEIQKITGCGSCDLVSLAGGAKNLVDTENRDVILKNIEISQRLHSIQQVILVNHTDCGAYGLSGTIPKLVADLETAKHIVSEVFPKLSVKTVIVVISAKNEEWNIHCLQAKDALNLYKTQK